MSISRRASVLLVLLALIACEGVAPRRLAAQNISSPLMSEEVIRQHGLVRSWWRQADVDSTRDYVESLTLQGDTLYVQTRRGTVNAIDTESGRVRWVQQVGSPEHVSTQVGASDRYAAILNGSVVYVYQHDNGKLVLKRKTVNAPGAGPAVSKTHVIVPTITGQIEAYPILDEKAPPWQYGSTGRAMLQPFMTSGCFGWATDRYHFYVAGTDPLKPRFRVEALEEIVANPGYQPPFFYVGSLDGHVRKVHELTGVMSWRYSAGEPIDQRPMAMEDKLYVSTRSGNLYCVQAEGHDTPPVGAAAGPPGAVQLRDGSELWRTSDAGRLLAASEKRLYCLDRLSRMVILNRADGGYLDAVGTSGFELAISNDVTDRIYACSRNGTVQCFHEVGVDKPLSHRHAQVGRLDAETPSKKPGGAKAPKAEPKKGAGGGDDFGGKGKDPFGGAGKAPAKDAPGKALPGKKVEEDPFGK